MHVESPFPSPGTDLGSLELKVTDEANDRYWRGAGVFPPPGASGALYPPMAVNFTILLVQQTIGEGVLHTWGRLDSHALSAPGAVTVSGTVLERFERRGRDYFVVASQVHAADGTLLWSAETELAASRRRTGAGEGEGSGPRRERVDVPPGGDRRSLTLTADLLRTYSRAGNFHSDDAAAQAMGLPGMVAMGMQTLGPAYGCCLDAWGPGFVASGSVEARFFGLVLEEDTVEARVIRDGELATFELVNATESTTTGAGRMALLSRK
ncbi:MAG: hypothetical protein HYU28_08330 [Actinobacteria bacterium]|nr:hypothetical protein [Actinomycetota bacterium]